jgi:hypothetical protein
MLTLKRKKVPLAKIGEVLGMTKDKVKHFLKKRTAITQEGETIPLAAGAKDLADKVLTVEQEHYARGANGMLPIVNARLLLSALNANAYPLTTNEVLVLRKLQNAITAVLAESEVVT